LKSGGFTNYLQPITTVSSARTWTLPDASGTIALTSDIPSLTGYVPYTGATTNVNLGTFDLTADVITGATGSFASSGGSDTFAINHSSGSGIALNITKGGNGEGLYINKTSGSGNAATIIGTLNATTLVKSGGTSSQFLKADGSVDSSTYLTTSAAASTYLPLAGGTLTGALNGTSAVFSSTVQASAYRLTGMTAGSGALYWSSDRVTLANYNATGLVVIEANSGTITATFGGATYNNDFVGTGRFTGALTGTSATFSGNVGVFDATPALRLSVRAADAPTTPTLGTASGHFIIGNGASTISYGLMFGVNNDGNSWIQSQRIDGTATAYNLLLQPSGGNVLINTTTDTGGSWKLQVNGSAYFTNTNSAGYTYLTIGNSGASGRSYDIGVGGNGVASPYQNSFYVYDNIAGQPRFYINSTGAATFSSSVTAASTLYLGNDGTYGSAYRTLGLTGITNGTHRIFAGTTDNLYIAAATSRGIEFWTDGSAATKMLISSGGNVTIGLTASNLRLGVRGADTGTTNYTFYADNGSNLLFSVRNDGQIATSLGTGTVTSTGGVLSSVSDMNLKDEDGFINNALEKVMNLKPRYFHWKEESGLPTDLRQLGFFAQEVNEALGEEAANSPKTKKDKWGIYDRAMIAMLTKAIQEQQAQIEELKAKIK
jgi:hypothetical protein